MRINEFANRETPRPSHARLFRSLITIGVVLLGTLSIVALALGMDVILRFGFSYGWSEWSYIAWFGALIGCVFFLIMRKVGRSYLLGFLTTVGWGTALMSLGMYLIAAESWNPFMVLGWLFPAIALLIYLMPVGIDLDVLLYGTARHPASFRALGDPDRHIDSLQNPAERDVPAQRR